MQKKLLSALVMAAAATASLFAQDPSIATPTVPTPPPGSAPTPQVQTAPAPNQIIYSPRLPSAEELTNVAAAQGLTIEQISQTAAQVTVITRNAAGQTHTVAYQLLPTPGTMPTTTVVQAPAVVQTTPAPTVIYQSAPSVIYYDTYERYRPVYYRPPVSLSFGFGYGFGGGHWGGHRGHWGHGHHHRGHWR